VPMITIPPKLATLCLPGASKPDIQNIGFHPQLRLKEQSGAGRLMECTVCGNTFLVGPPK